MSGSLASIQTYLSDALNEIGSDTKASGVRTRCALQKIIKECGSMRKEILLKHKKPVAVVEPVEEVKEPEAVEPIAEPVAVVEKKAKAPKKAKK
jgi:hypothetical protein